MIYVGIDIAKTKHYASVVDSNGVILLEAFSFYNSKTGFEFFWKNLPLLIYLILYLD